MGNRKTAQSKGAHDQHGTYKAAFIQSGIDGANSITKYSLLSAGTGEKKAGLRPRVHRTMQPDYTQKTRLEN